MEKKQMEEIMGPMGLPGHFVPLDGIPMGVSTNFLDAFMEW